MEVDYCHPEWMTLVQMNNKISEIQQKRPALMKNMGKKQPVALESWIIEEYYVPYQAS